MSNPNLERWISQNPETLHLETEHLVLRMPHPHELEANFESLQTSWPQLNPWLRFAQAPITLEQFHQRFAVLHAQSISGESISLGMFLRSSGAFVGRVGFPFVNWEVPKLEIGYWLDSRHTGHGYMQGAVECLTRFAFDTLRVKRLEIYCDVRNLASRKVAEKAGFALEVIQKKALPDYQNLGNAADACIYVRFE